MIKQTFKPYRKKCLKSPCHTRAPGTKRRLPRVSLLAAKLFYRATIPTAQFFSFGGQNFEQNGLENLDIVAKLPVLSPVKANSGFKRPKSEKSVRPVSVF